MKLRERDIECKCCERKAIGMFYNGLVPWGYYCTDHARYYKLTPVIPYAKSVSIQAPSPS